MRYIKYLILLFVPVVIVMHGCESNDKATNSVCIPQPVNKKILVEFFTNSGCNPCIAVHGYLDGITANTCTTINDTSVIVISVHTKYPYILDSLYRANVPQNDARASYYGINFTPQSRLDGITMGTFSSSDWSAQMDAEFRTQTYLDINLSNTFNTSNDSGTVTANISLISALPTSDNVVHVIITESNIPYITAPNGVKYPDDVMRYMITGSDGEDIAISSNTIVTKSYGLNSNWNGNECYIAVFIQSKSTKQVFGVERIKVL
ncbi:MAG TPA: Omp28-related outer membrane protein [Ignavibacteria bacterium]|jgi:hypothetical protein